MKMNIAISRVLKLPFISAFISIFLVSVIHITAQESPATSTAQLKRPAPSEIDRIIREFTNAEAEYRSAFGRYGHTREIIVQTVNGKKVTGEYHRITRTVNDKDGKPAEKVVTSPRTSLTEIEITKDDLEDLGDKFQFALAAPDSSKYKFSYVGSERVRDIDLYVFEVKPIALSKDERLFEGRVWVDSKQLRVLKTKGRARHKGNQIFPELETYRTVVDGRYLFPSVAASDEEIVFKSGARVRVRMNVKFTEYTELK
jgi:hypothetical protein